MKKGIALICGYVILAIFFSPVHAYAISRPSTHAFSETQTLAVSLEKNTMPSSDEYTTLSDHELFSERVVGDGTYYATDKTPKKIVYGGIRIEGSSVILALHDRTTSAGPALTQTTFDFNDGFSVDVLIEALDRYQNERRIKIMALGISVQDRLDHIVKHKILGLTLSDTKRAEYESLERLTSRLWREADITPFLVRQKYEDPRQDLMYTTEKVNSIYKHDAHNLDVGEYHVVVDQNTGEVDPVHEDTEVTTAVLSTLDDYRQQDPEAYAALVAYAERFKRRYGNKKLVFINSTPQGGGVALMRHANLRILRQLGVDIVWLNLLGNNAESYPPVLRERFGDSFKDVFLYTKMFHNVFQNVLPSDKLPSEAEIDRMAAVLREWGYASFLRMKSIVKDAAVIDIDDHQPTWCTRHIADYLAEEGITVHWNYRNHIQLESKLIAQAKRGGNARFNAIRKFWEFLFGNISDYIAWFVAHPSEPIDAFVPKAYLEEARIPWIFHPAHSDLNLDGLNKPLTSQQLRDWLMIFNARVKEQVIVIKKEGVETTRVFGNKKPLDLNRPYWAEKARFDPAKGYDELLAMYFKYRAVALEKGKETRSIAQLVLIGHGAVDDPDGIPMLDHTYGEVEKWRKKLIADFNISTEEAQQIVDDIKIARLPHNDQIMNAVVSGSELYFQPSTKEGSEINVSEAICKGKIVFALHGNSSGIPLQINNLFAEDRYAVEQVQVPVEPYVLPEQATGLLFEATVNEAGTIPDEIKDRYTSEMAAWALRLQEDELLYQRLTSNARKYYRRNTTVSNTLFWLALSVLPREQIPANTDEWGRDIFLRIASEENPIAVMKSA